jgi:hypothetical protein
MECGHRKQKMTVPRRRDMLVAGALLLVSVVLVGADALGGGVTYDFEAEGSVTVEPATADDPDFYGEREVRVGTMTATNGFVFTRALSLPSLDGCLAGVEDHPRNRVWVDYDYDGYTQSDTIAGGTSRTLPVRASIPVDANRTDAVTYNIERGDGCDVQRDTPTLIVSVGEDETRD